MKRRRGHFGALRGLLTRPATFCCFILLLTSFAGTVEGATVTVQVPVNQRTFPAISGITITQGQTLTITATGSACYDTDCNPPVSPQGSGRGLGEANFKLPGAPQHGLVCGIGGQSPSDLFFVGSSFSGQATRSGSLYCGMNEADIPDVWPDNRGGWTVTVTTGSTTSVNIARIWNLTGSESQTNCQDPSKNGTWTFIGTMTITQSRENFQATYRLDYADGDFAQGTFNGTIDSSGRLSGTFSDEESSGTFTGSVSGNTLSLQYSGQITVGERCDFNGSLSGTRQIVGSDTVTITNGPNASSSTVDSGSTVTLSVTATDSMNHTLSYAWFALCSGVPSNGSFDNASTQIIPVPTIFPDNISVFPHPWEVYWSSVFQGGGPNGLLFAENLSTAVANGQYTLSVNGFPFYKNASIGVSITPSRTTVVSVELERLISDYVVVLASDKTNYTVGQETFSLYVQLCCTTSIAQSKSLQASRVDATQQSTRVDWYVWVEIPGGGRFFLMPDFTNFADLKTPVVASLPIQNFAGPILNMPTPDFLPVGVYTFFAVGVVPGSDPFNSANWVTNRAELAVTLTQ